MAVARARSVALIGITGHPVEVEADVGQGVVGTHFIGLLDTAISEARDRVRSALTNSHFGWPDARLTVSLFPASLPKRGSIFDVAIAIAILAAAGAIPAARVAEPFFLGELGLDGRLRPVRGVLPATIAAAEAGARTIIVPSLNWAEARLVPGLTVVPAACLRELVDWLRGDDTGTQAAIDEAAALTDPSAADSPHSAPRPGGFPTFGGEQRYPPRADRWPGLDLSDVAGQPLARKALEVCAAGGHNLWLLGPPGTGKTMLAERLPTLLPDLDRDQSLEVTAIHSVAGALPLDRPLVMRPPFVAPHHTATVVSMVGGGSGAIRPGAVSLAHRGVLFLDEAPEFAVAALDALRQPLESGIVTVSRAAGRASFPARFMLVLAANPCPCGQPGTSRHPCQCVPGARRRYLARLSGPLLDRIDVKVTVVRATRAELLADRRLAEPSATVCERVAFARERAAKRLTGTPWRHNGEIASAALHRDFRLPDRTLAPLHRGLDLGLMSARALDRVLRVAWTLGDLAGKDQPEDTDISMALAMWMGEH